MSLSHLTELIGPPPQSIPSIDWSEVETKIGSPLPPDYRAFIDRFGFGKIDDFIHVFTPYGPTQWVDLIWRSSDHAEWHYFRGEIHPPFPAAGGLLHFAGTDNGDAIYWKTDRDPLQWSIVIYEGRGPDFEVFEMPMTAFLAEVLSGEIRCGIFPDDFPSQTPRFEPYPPIG